MNTTGCLSLLLSIWVKTTPNAYFDASDSIWKGHVKAMAQVNPGVPRSQPVPQPRRVCTLQAAGTGLDPGYPGYLGNR